MRFGVLGPVWAVDDAGRMVPLGGTRLRALLAMLLLDAGRPVPLDRLIDGLYGDRPPSGAVNALQSQVSRLRSLLPVEFDGGGYRLAIDPDEVDAHRFTRLAAAGHAALTPVTGGPGALMSGAGGPSAGGPDSSAPGAGMAGPHAARSGIPNPRAAHSGVAGSGRAGSRTANPGVAGPGAGGRGTAGSGAGGVAGSGAGERAAALLREALGLWRGEPLSDVRAAPFAAAQVTRLTEARRLAVEDLAAAELAAGAPRAVLGDLRDLVSADPLRERAWALLMRALAADGRPAEALTAFETARHALADQLGADPSPDLSAIHAAILRGTPSVHGTAVPGGVPEAIIRSRPDARGTPDPPGPAELRGTPNAPGTPDPPDVLDLRSTPEQRSAPEQRGMPEQQGTPELPGAAGVSRAGDGHVRERSGGVGVPARVVGVDRHGVPAQLTSFVGRDDDLRAVVAALRAGRLVTLHGPGGSGKTRLAVETASRHAGEVRFVELAAATGPDVPRAVSDAIGLRDTGLRTRDLRDGGPSVTERLIAALTARDVLLVLDNCEHVIADAAALAARLLAACPGVRILATSREPLGLTGEVLRPVGGLPEPAAIRLFLERAALVTPAVARNAEDRNAEDPNTEDPHAAAVREICRTLDGLPLALELAAARLHALPVSEVAARVGDRFRLLNRGSRTAPERQRTLRAVVEWSWELLSEPERALARRFTVFRGGCGLDAVEGVCGPDVVDLLGDLVGKSLIERDGDRYRMLETIRAFCAERLAESGEDPAVRAAHASWFLTVAQAADRELRTGRQLVALRRLDADRDNLHAALRDADAGTGLRLLSALSFYWWLRGLRTEAADLARMLLEKRPEREATEEYALCELTARLGITTTTREPTPYLAGITRPPVQPFLMYLTAIVSGPPADSLADVHTVHEHLRSQLYGDPWSEALGAIGAGWMVLLAGGAPAQAEPEFTAALSGFRALGERWGTMLALNGLFEMASARGDHAVAEERMVEAMRLAGELGSTVDTADLLRSRADSRLRAGDLDGATADLTRTAELARGCGAPELLSAALLGLGRLALRRGDRAEARRLCREALDECPVDRYGTYGLRVTALAVLARIAEQDGDDVTAGRLFREVFTIVPGPDGLPALGEALDGLVALAVRAGDADRAAVLLGASTTLLIGTTGRSADVAAKDRAPGSAGENPRAGTVRDLLGDPAYRDAYGRGARLTRAEAIAYAIRA